MTRREFLGAAAVSALAQSKDETTPAVLDPNRLRHFISPLSTPPTARIDRVLQDWGALQGRFPVYRFPIGPIERRVHCDLPPTRMWGMASASPGPTIEARNGEPLFIEWIDKLPDKHFLPVDYSIEGARHGGREVRTIFHLHGGRVPPASDGYPESWYPPGKPTLTFYPNGQEATLLWYHDHAMSVTRLNMMAGLFGLYILRDEFEDSLNLPKGKFEIPLVLFDRSFRADGQLYYPVSGNPEKPWVPEFFGDAVLANGDLFPYLQVEARRYRFRILNASNSRFLYLSLSNEQAFQQIGSDQGLLPAAVELQRLTLAPGERADVVVDFSGKNGKQIVLHSDTFQILQFRVSDEIVQPLKSFPARLRQVNRMSAKDAVRTRLLTLGGGGDPDDVTSMTQPLLLNGARWRDPITEVVELDSVEIWSLVNVTDDSHPIHLHLVRFQILDRRAFDVFTYLNDRQMRYTADAVPPDVNEAGWKDTVRADPGVVTRIIVRFDGYAGRYVWHCHLLEHEDYEMMRPYEIVHVPK